MGELTDLHIDEASDAWLGDTVWLGHQLTAELPPQWEEGLVVATGRGCPTGSHSTSTQLVCARDEGEDGSYIQTLLQLAMYKVANLQDALTSFRPSCVYPARTNRCDGVMEKAQGA